MKRSTAIRLVFASLVALPLLPVCAFMLNGAPVVVFFIGAAAFVINVLLLVWLFAVSLPLAGAPPAACRLRFTIGDWLCLTTFLFGILLFLVSGLQCSSAEEASRPNPLPAVELRHFFWEMESGLVFVTVGGLVWIRSALNRQRK